MRTTALVGFMVFVAGGLTSSAGHAEPLVVLKTQNRIVEIDSATPGAPSADKPITGLDANETVESIDLRPDTGGVYGYTAQGNLYLLAIGLADVTATKVTTTAAVLTTGPRFDLDFVPSEGQARIVSSARSNVRIQPTTGTGITDPALFYANGASCVPGGVVDQPEIVAVAFRHSFGGAIGFTDVDGANFGMLQLGIDARTSRLVKIGSASLNDGCVLDRGALGVTIDANTDAGFDISTATGIAYATLTVGGTPGLYTVDTTSGVASLVGTLTAGAKDVAAIGAPKPAVLWGVTKLNELVRFNASDPSTLLATPRLITQVGLNDTVVAIDAHPSTGKLYILTSNVGTMKLHTVDKATGVATAVTPFGAGFPLEGKLFGMAFEPSPDTIRVVTSSAKNHLVTTATGALLSTHTDLTYGDGTTNPPYITAIAQSTSLFALDTRQRRLAVSTSLDGGVLTSVASLGVATSETPDDLATAGFDLAPDGTPYAVMTTGDPPVSRLYQLNLSPSPVRAAASFGRVIGTPGEHLIQSLAVDMSELDAGPLDAGPLDGGQDAAALDAGDASPSADSGPRDGSALDGSPRDARPVSDGSGIGQIGSSADDGCTCSETPPSRAAPSALFLTLTTLWLVRRKRPADA